MKKIINGRLYDTRTAEEIDSWSNGLLPGDFERCEETLYRKKTGEFFLLGEGGPLSKYVKQNGSNSWSGSRRIIPMSVDEAKKWCEDYSSADCYIRLFGEVEE